MVLYKIGERLPIFALLWIDLFMKTCSIKTIEMDLEGKEKALLGEVAHFQCSVKLFKEQAFKSLEIWWSFENQIISNSRRYQTSIASTTALNGSKISQLEISSVTWDDAGTYACFVEDNSASEIKFIQKNIELVIISPPKGNLISDGKGFVDDSSNMTCLIEGKPLPLIKWLRHGVEVSNLGSKYRIFSEKLSERKIKSLITINSLSHEDNGTFLCTAENKYGVTASVVHNIVLDTPQVEIDYVKALGMSKIFLNWTVVDWNSAVSKYFLSMQESSNRNVWLNDVGKNIPVNETYFVITGLKPNTGYRIKLAAKNEFGTGEYSSTKGKIRTLDFDPKFVPHLSIKGSTKNSVSIGWNKPSNHSISNFVDFYKLTKESNDQMIHLFQEAEKYSSYLWRDLKPATNYSFTVAACIALTNECWQSSEPVFARTEDGLSEPPSEVQVYCKYDNKSKMNFVDIHWKEPIEKHGEIEFYKIQLHGEAQYMDSHSELHFDSFGPEIKTESADVHKTRFDFLFANTNYTVDICAVTRLKKCGPKTSATCTMNVMPPGAEHLSIFQWFTEYQKSRTVLKLKLPNLPERNGKICCFRIILVKLKKGQDPSELPDQTELTLSNYEQVHETSTHWGAYVADILSPDEMGKNVFLGDGENNFPGSISTCPLCEFARKIMYNQRYKNNRSRTLDNNLVKDGLLDINFNYSGFVEVIVHNSSLIGRTPYIHLQQTGFFKHDLQRSNDGNVLLNIMAGIVGGLVLVSLSLLLTLLLLKQYSKKVTSSPEVDFSWICHQFCSSVSKKNQSQCLVQHELPKEQFICSIKKNDMLKAYLERHKDSDYGFQVEFEMLPEHFQDRTYENCDKSCNITKNRYPDIKCYDQTRVTLVEIENLEGSDYINANIINGYKRRKQWICAQGPLPHTIGDFWRMIYEHKSEIVIMLTNLEEYNRVKCSKYWPEAGENVVCCKPIQITIQFMNKKYYSDYIERQFKMIVIKEDIKDIRIVSQYHYLQWKDFNAPEHAPGMLRFIKRINEAWSRNLIRNKVVVHCSAGVGRSGTLIAIDTLMDQMKEEHQVKIFETISELRHQRNYLVQSVRQYLFVYRAIMELATFGDTEIEINDFKENWLALASNEDNLHKEFEKFNIIVDYKKAITVGNTSENQERNRSKIIVPFDQNRVILTPDLSRPHSTYINASFIEGYHNDESFIVTQDPLPATAEDFWRMVMEHNVCIVVMLSGENSWQYWSENEDTFGVIKVTCTVTESFDSFTKREFLIFNSKTEEEKRIVHLAFIAWETEDFEGSDSVPSSTYELIELIEFCIQKKNEIGFAGPIAVHCLFGSNRSGVFVAIYCLVLQIRNEGRCDIFTAVKKLRGQRIGMIQTMNQYKFIYQVISDFLDMDRAKENEYALPINAAECCDR